MFISMTCSHTAMPVHRCQCIEMRTDVKYIFLSCASMQKSSVWVSVYILVLHGNWNILRFRQWLISEEKSLRRTIAQHQAVAGENFFAGFHTSEHELWCGMHGTIFPPTHVFRCVVACLCRSQDACARHYFVGNYLLLFHGLAGSVLASFRHCLSFTKITKLTEIMSSEAIMTSRVVNGVLLRCRQRDKGQLMQRMAYFSVRSRAELSCWFIDKTCFVRQKFECCCESSWQALSACLVRELM